jgi:hypothetical protein
VEQLLARDLTGHCCPDWSQLILDAQALSPGNWWEILAKSFSSFRPAALSLGARVLDIIKKMHTLGATAG